MGNRRKAREIALKAIFEIDFNDSAMPAIIARIRDDQQPEAEVMHFTQVLLETYDKNRDSINSAIEDHSNNWKLSRMANVDRNILRLGACEILFLHDVPKSVTINEYLEIAKKYGNEESSSFVNGILDKIEKRHA